MSALNSQQLQNLIDQYLSNGGHIKKIDNYVDQTVNIEQIVLLHKVPVNFIHKEIRESRFPAALNPRAPNGNLPDYGTLIFSRREVDAYFFRRGQKHKGL